MTLFYSLLESLKSSQPMGCCGINHLLGASYNFTILIMQRSHILIDQLNIDLKYIFISIANNSDFEIDVFESDLNHIHFLIRYIPRLSISQIVRRLKQVSTYELWILHYSILSKNYWSKKILWSDGYFVCSIGEASPERIRNYILNQG